MFFIATLLPFLGQVISAVSHAGESAVLGGRVRVGRCRAKCLASFHEDTSCQEYECQQCWSFCQHIGVSENEDEQSNICQHEECGHGCKAACRFFLHSNTTPRRKVETKVGSLEFSHPPSLFGCSLSWGELEVSSNTLRSNRDTMPITSTVYLVLGQDRAGQWYEVTQTPETKAVMTGTMTAKLDQVRVMAIRQEGVKVSMAFMTDGTNCEEVERKMEEETAERNREHVDPSLRPTLKFSSSEEIFSEISLTWAPQSLSHQPGSPGSRFLITWHKIPADFLVVGSLHTSSSSIRLSLESDNFYIVEIHDLWTKAVSPPTLINTTTRDRSNKVSLVLVIFLGVTALVVLAFGGFLLNRRSFRTSGNNPEQNNTEVVPIQEFHPCIKETAQEFINHIEMADSDEDSAEWNISIWVSSILSDFKQSLKSTKETHKDYFNLSGFPVQSA